MRPRPSPLPTTDMKASRSAPAAQPLLALRVDATEGKNTRIAWIASLQCQMTGRPDDGGVAQELGRVIGALGKRVERQAF